MYSTLVQQLTNNLILCSFWPLYKKFYLFLVHPTSMVAANLYLSINFAGLTSSSIKKIFAMDWTFLQLA